MARIRTTNSRTTVEVVEAIVLALDYSSYGDDILIEGWNRSAEEAMDGLPLIVKRRLGAVLDRMRV